MTQRAFTLTLDNAFEDAVGPSGASRQRYQQLREKLLQALPRMRQQPQREAAPILALPSKTDDLQDIETTARTISEHFNTLVIVGMGGSSLGAETLASIHSASSLKLHYVDNIDPHTMQQLMETLDWKNTAFLIISKSGNTVETLAQMAMFIRKAQAAAMDVGKHFLVITIPDNNPLHQLAQHYGMKLLAHDPDLGGRFSILSSAGLLPAAAIGMDIKQLRAGAQAVVSKNFAADSDHAHAVDSAALHIALLEKNIRNNVTMHYGDRLGCLASWYRQCWSESLGKCAHATTPIRSRGATDQHSQLQLYLDGPKDKFFSLMLLDYKNQGEAIDYAGNADKRLDFLKGHTMGDLMVAEARGTLATLIKRGCPVRSFEIKTLNEEVFGALLMHFTLEVIFTAELLQVNAFDQPAVEESKVLALRYLTTG